jgi:long-chain-fatty-acid--[acyl-carrier-protein] ligase
LRLLLWFRYRVVVEGTDKLNAAVLSKPGGVLFLPNHPGVFVDPIAVSLAIWPYYPIRPLIVEYMYYTPVIHTVMKFLNALPMPNFATSSNSLKRKKSEQAIQAVVEGLRAKENFLIYPAGKIKLSAYEAVGGSSAVHQIVQALPDVNIVLVRTKGLWGSSFGTYIDGKSPDMVPTIWQGVKFCLKNLLFFTPRRQVIVEFEAAPADFPYKASRLELNRYLEKWYNKPDGLTPQQGESPGDSLILVSYSMWGEKYLESQRAIRDNIDQVDLAALPEELKATLTAHLARLTDRSLEDIGIDMDLSADLGMDSLDIAEVAAFLHDQFNVKSVPVNELTTVGRVMAIADKQIVFEEEAAEESDLSKWRKGCLAGRERLEVAIGETIPEVFLNVCNAMGKRVACGDDRTGVLTYKEFKLRALLLADYISKLPGSEVGILLPASSAANLLIIATMLAGKVPLMVNWTVGPRHLEAVVALSKVQVIFSSWSFIDRLEHVDLSAIDDRLLMVEDVRRELSWKDKLRALWRSKLSTAAVMRSLKIDLLNGDNQAVLLFTSGTESLPKGVPLSHRNILTNVKDINNAVTIYSDDVLLGILPPFHAFGFTVSALFGFLGGLRVASFPDPTDGRKLAASIEKWQATILCGAPTFLKGIFKAAQPEQLHTLRLCVTGAEKAPPELFSMLADLGKEEILLEGYGITECSPVLTVNRIGEPHIGVGRPLASVELATVHPETLEPLPQGAQGLILARGASIFKGYLNSNITSPFVEVCGASWYRTGDLGFLDSAGNLIISGRQKRFVKIGGEMVSLVAVEDFLQSEVVKRQWHPIVEGPFLAILGREAAGEKAALSAFTLFDCDPEMLNALLRDGGFSNLVRIGSVTKLKEIPLMGSGKVNYRALDEHLLALP